MATYQLSGKYYYEAHSAASVGHWYRLFHEFDASDDTAARKATAEHLLQAYPDRETKDLRLVRQECVPLP